jgi:hypothetical protein
MMEILPSPKENVLLVKITGNITKEDYDRLVPVMEAKIQQHGKIKLYTELENLGLPTLGALWEDIKMDVKHYRDFSHVAVVGEPEWLASITKLVAPLVPAEVRVFSLEEKDAAMQWITS